MTLPSPVDETVSDISVSASEIAYLDEILHDFRNVDGKLRPRHTLLLAGSAERVLLPVERRVTRPLYCETVSTVSQLNPFTRIDTDLYSVGDLDPETL